MEGEYKADNSKASMTSKTTQLIENYDRDDDPIAFEFICRRCNGDASDGKLICPCECTGDREFIHIHCLEILSNVRKQSHCTYCDAAFPLEIKYKSLIEICKNTREMCDMFRATCSFIFVIFWMLMYHVLMCIVSEIVYTIFLRYDAVTEIAFICSDIFLGIFYVIYMKYKIKLLQYTFTMYV